MLWGLVAGVVLSGAIDHARWLGSVSHGHRVLAEAVLVTGTGLVVVLVAVILMGRFAGRVRHEAESLAAIARGLADEGLPRVVEALRDGADGGAAAAAANVQWPTGRVSEIAAAAGAITSIYRTAVAATAAEAGLRTASGRSWSAWAAGTSRCCTGSCASSTPWSSRRRAPPRWRSCSRLTTSPPGCAATRRA